MQCHCLCNYFSDMAMRQERPNPKPGEILRAPRWGAPAKISRTRCEKTARFQSRPTQPRCARRCCDSLRPSPNRRAKKEYTGLKPVPSKRRCPVPPTSGYPQGAPQTHTVGRHYSGRFHFSSPSYWRAV